VTRAALLWMLLGAFAVRVAGQLLVACGAAPILPSMDAWQSGLLPYPLLVAAQVAILGLFAAVCVQFTRRRGCFVSPRRWLGTPLWIAGWIYAGAMVVRYGVLMTDIIPVVFHIVLASFLIVVAHHHRVAGSR
jgi:uncharacterized protein